MEMVPGRDDEEIPERNQLVDRTRSSAVFVPPQLSGLFNEPLVLAKFWARVEKSAPEQCWPWRGDKNHRGYGRFREKMTHRLAYELVKGPIPEGLIVRHRCDNPPCCNPDHLLVGTYADNTDDAVERNRLPTGERSGTAKITVEQVRYIRANPDNLTRAALVQRFGLSKCYISAIRSGKVWRTDLRAVDFKRKRKTSARSLEVE